MLNFIKFAFAALVVGAIVSFFTYNSLKSGKNLDSPQTRKNVNGGLQSSTSPAISPSVTGPQETGPEEQVQEKKVNLQDITADLKKQLGIAENSEEFVIKSSPIGNENVVGFRYNIGNNDEIVSRRISDVQSYFNYYGAKVINKEEYFESNPFQQYEEYQLYNLHCFMHAYSMSGDYFIDLGCNSEN